MSLARSLTRSTPVRLAVTFATFLILAFLLSGVVVYRLMDAELVDRLDEDLANGFQVLAATYHQDDVEDLSAAVDSHGSLAERHERLYALAGKDGTVLAGSQILPQQVRAPGYSTVDAGGLGPDLTDDYRVLSGDIGPYTLSIAFSFAETNELRRVVLYGYLWATVIAAALAVAGGALLAARVQRRLDAIAETMTDVSQGKLDARIPLIGRDDDVDAVSRQVNAALDRIVSLMENLRQVGFDIAHDLRTPLNRLRMTLEQAQARTVPDETAADLEEAMAEIAQATQTFDALLRIAQIEAGARRERFQAVDLQELIRDIGEIYGEVAIDDGKTLDAVASPADPIQGDRELLVQMVANLIENSLRHTPSGSHVTVGCMAAGDAVCLTCADDGPGIPEEERDKVFRRLYRMDKSRTTPGSGLGLSMVKAIADLHGAKIILTDNRPGLSVTVTFPRAADLLTKP